MEKSSAIALAAVAASFWAASAQAETAHLPTLAIADQEGNLLGWNEDLPFAFNDGNRLDYLETPGAQTPEAGTFVSLVGKAGYPMLWLDGDGPATLKYTLVGRKPAAESWIDISDGGHMAEDGTVHYGDEYGAGAELVSHWRLGRSIYSRGNTGELGGVNFFYRTHEAPGEDLNGNGITGETLTIDNWSGPMADGQPLRIAFGHVFNNGRSVLAFFDNGRGETSYDDMVVRIDVVPLPATVLLMGGALAGLAAFGWRRKARTA